MWLLCLLLVVLIIVVVVVGFVDCVLRLVVCLVWLLLLVCVLGWLLSLVLLGCCLDFSFSCGAVGCRCLWLWWGSVVSLICFGFLDCGFVVDLLLIVCRCWWVVFGPYGLWVVADALGGVWV